MELDKWAKILFPSAVTPNFFGNIKHFILYLFRIFFKLYVKSQDSRLPFKS